MSKGSMPTKHALTAVVCSVKGPGGGRGEGRGKWGGYTRLATVEVMDTDTHCFPPTAVTKPLTAVRVKHPLPHSGRSNHFCVSELYDRTYPLYTCLKYAMSPHAINSLQPTLPSIVLWPTSMLQSALGGGVVGGGDYSTKPSPTHLMKPQHSTQAPIYQLKVCQGTVYLVGGYSTKSVFSYTH